MRLEFCAWSLDARLHPDTCATAMGRRDSSVAPRGSSAGWRVRCSHDAGLAGFLLETVPVGVIGAVATAVVVDPPSGRRSGLELASRCDLALLLTIAACTPVVAALLVTAVQRPVRRIAGLPVPRRVTATVTVGLVRWNARDLTRSRGRARRGGRDARAVPAAHGPSPGRLVVLALTAIVPSLPPRRA